MNPAEVLEYYKAREAAIVSSIRELVDIESPSFNAEQSSLVGDWLENAFKATGADVSVERVLSEGVGTHLVIRAFPGDEKPVLLLGHTDTVHPIGTCGRNAT